nr:MAG TPA: hypothetical protein [Caudoviricetes sp.]
MPDRYGRMTQEEKAAQQQKNAEWYQKNRAAVDKERQAGNAAPSKQTSLPSPSEVALNPGDAIMRGARELDDQASRVMSKDVSGNAGNEKAKAEQQARHEANKGVKSRYSENPDLLANPNDAAKAAQDGNALKRTPEQWRAMGEDPKDHPDQVYDPGDTDGNKVEVSPEKGNMNPGDPISPEGKEKDPWAETKAAWKHLTDVFGEKVSALQNELEGRLANELTPTEREVNNPFAGDDVPESKEATIDDVKNTLDSTKNDSMAVAKGIGDIGGAALDTAGAAAKEGGNAIVEGMGLDKDALKSTGKTLAGLSGLFSTSPDTNDKVPDSGWHPKSINDLFKGN